MPPQFLSKDPTNEENIMNHSYKYTKDFIEKQVKILNEPLEITQSLKDILEYQTYEPDELPLSEQQLSEILVRLNRRIQTRNNTVFTSQVTHQIVTQILKLEQNKLNILCMTALPEGWPQDRSRGSSRENAISGEKP